MHRAIVNYAFTNAGTQRHHPRGAREGITGAVVLEAVSAGVVVRVAAKVRQDEERGVARIFGLALDGFPHFGAKAVGATNALDVEGICSGVRDIDVVHGNPQQAGRELAHQAARDIDGELVGAG